MLRTKKSALARLILVNEVSQLHLSLVASRATVEAVENANGVCNCH
jgi:hypothetical protein